MALKPVDRLWSHVPAAIPIALLIGCVVYILFNQKSWLDQDPNQLAGCAWHTECWHDEYLDLFVNDGLVQGTQSEGEFLGIIAYDLKAISTENLLAFVSVLLAVITFFVGIEIGRSRLRRQHTVDVLMGMFSSDRLANANSCMARLNLEARRGEFRIDGNISEDLDQHVICMLDFYEFICQGAFEGSLSKRSIKQVRGGPMRTTYYACRQYIEDRRNMLDRPNLYMAYERFITKVVRDAEV